MSRRMILLTLFTVTLWRSAALGGEAPEVTGVDRYPPSPVIVGIEWSAPETIIRRAPGGDNWPLTWADDDHLYTAYGDGRGFEPFVSEKLGMGFARIAGGPADFAGCNIRAATLENRGQGAAGKKASGLLMVDGVLYLLVRNADNSQIAWSEDHGKSWNWCDWKFATSFGCPTFLNFGKNYAGARDEYVYIYSPDHDSAYERADRMVLARVARDRIKVRDAYQFFARLDASGQPVWTPDIAGRGGVLTNPGECYRSGITYNAGLKRYLWCVIDPDSRHPQGMRFEGGFRLYDAPEPWGPWTTVYATEHWDVGPGETGSFPTKWMSADGKTLYLVFSGDDHFSVRQARLRTATEFDWRTASPASQGMSAERLEALRAKLAAQKTKAFLVARNDRIVCEWYAPDHGAARAHYTASMAKALVGGTAAAIAIGDGLVGLDDKAAQYVPQWRRDARKSQITIRHLGSHTSGIEDAEADDLPHEKLTGWKGDFWKRLPPPRDPFTIARDTAPLLFDPGKDSQYSNPGLAMLGYVLTAALRDSPHKDLRTLLRERIMRPIGVPDKEWSVGYGQTIVVDGLPLVGTWGGGSFTARALARVGRLMLRQGDWEGRRVLAEDAVRQVRSDAGTPGTCGIGWWSNNEGRHAKLPKDAFWAAGAGHQILLVIPSLELIAVRNGAQLASPAEYDAAAYQELFAPLMDAVTAR